MTTQQEWTAVGRFVAMMVKLFTIASRVFKEKGLGFESIEWLTTKGENFLAQKVGEIAEECRKWATMIGVNVVGINRSLTPQQVLDATGRKQYTDREVVEAMPRGEGDEKEIVFFQVGKGVSDDELEKEFELRGLKPADPYSLAKANQDDPAFADSRPNCTHWKDEGGKWCYIAFNRWRDGGRGLNVSRNDFIWNDGWWFSGVRK